MLSFYVYIICNRKLGALYVGMTDDLAFRIWKHKEKVHRGHTATYGIDRLVWYELHDTRESAFRRERQIKEWRRAWKIRLIEAENPDWDDLYLRLNG